MGRQRIEVGEHAAGERLDRFLAARQAGLSRGDVRHLLDAGQVRLNGRPARAGDRLAQGDALELIDWPQSGAAQPDADAPLRVVHEDPHLLIVDKPAGMPSHPLRPGEQGTLAGALLARYPELAGIGHSPREPGLIHRLDTDTSGLMLIARDTATFGRLLAALKAGQVEKHYRALCQGSVAAPARHRAHLTARGRRVRVHSEAGDDSVPIETRVLTSEPRGLYSLVEVSVHVARRHQVRAHLSALGHPIAADALYHGPKIEGLNRHFLHANQLAFSHPTTGKIIEIESPLPPDLSSHT